MKTENETNLIIEKKHKINQLHENNTTSTKQTNNRQFY